MTERRRPTCDYLRGMRARGHDFKLPDFSTILHKKSFSGAMQIPGMHSAYTSYGNVSVWVAGCLSQPVLCQND